MIDPRHKRLSIVRQCELVSISGALFYRPPASESEENLALMRLIDEAWNARFTAPAPLITTRSILTQPSRCAPLGSSSELRPTSRRVRRNGGHSRRSLCDPSGDLPKHRCGVRQRVHANIVALEGFDEGFRHAVRLRTGVKHGIKFKAVAKSRVSLAV